MKNFATILVLLFVLSVPAFADEGGVPIGGKSCPQGQTCLTEGDVPLGGKTCPQGQTCLADEGDIHTGGKSDNSIYTDFFDFLESIFG
jgi:hypothetical protein